MMPHAMGQREPLPTKKTWSEFSLAPRLIHLLKSRIIKYKKIINRCSGTIVLIYLRRGQIVTVPILYPKFPNFTEL